MLWLHSNGASLTANMNFGYRQENWPHISGGGSLTIGMSGTTISILLQLGENSDHQPTVSDLSTSCSIGSLSVHESGGPRCRLPSSSLPSLPSASE